MEDRIGMKLLDGAAALSGEGDWAQLCLYTGGCAMEVDLGPVQLAAVAIVLGLVSDGQRAACAVGDDVMAGKVLPALLAALPKLWSE